MRADRLIPILPVPINWYWQWSLDAQGIRPGERNNVRGTMETRGRSGVGLLGAIAVVALLVAAAAVGLIVLGILAALVVIGVVVLAVDRLLLTISPKRRERQ